MNLLNGRTAQHVNSQGHGIPLYPYLPTVMSHYIPFLYYSHKGILAVPYTYMFLLMLFCSLEKSSCFPLAFKAHFIFFLSE